MTMRNWTRTCAVLLLPLLCTAPAVGADKQEPELWLPDLFFAPEAADDFAIDTVALPGRWLYRFRTSLPNVGLGEFVIESREENQGNVCSDNVQQRIFRSDGSFVERPTGGFSYDESTQMMQAVAWAEYRLRVVLDGDGVGPVVANGGKPQVRITSSGLYDNTIPNVPPPSQRIFASNCFHGISVGYSDIYTKALDLQWVDFTGVCPGEYWLEIEINRGRYVEESSYANNVTHVKVTLPDQGLTDCIGNGGEAAAHAGDWNLNGVLELPELLRVIQFYNSPSYSCAAIVTEDGYAPGGNDTNCVPHDADYAQDWEISLPEVLRVIQLYNSKGYYICPELETDDGFCPYALP